MIKIIIDRLNLRLCKIIISTFVILSLPFISPLGNWHGEHRSLYGFPQIFIIIYADAFYLAYGADIPRFWIYRIYHFSWIALVWNVSVMYCCLTVLFKTYYFFHNRYTK